MADTLTDGKPVVITNAPTAESNMEAYLNLGGDPEATEVKATNAGGEVGIGEEEGNVGEIEQIVAEPEAEVIAETVETEDIEEGEDAEKKSNPWALLRKNKKELAAEREKAIRLEERLAALERMTVERQQQVREPEAKRVETNVDTFEIPEYEADPLGHLHARLQIAEARNVQVQQNQQTQQVYGRIAAEEQAYSRVAPDYEKARDYLIQREFARAKTTGLSDQDALQMVDVRRQMLLGLAWRNNKNVAEVAYEMAKADGWTGETNTPVVSSSDVARQKVTNQIARERQAQGSLGGIPSTPARPAKSFNKQEVLAMTEAEMDHLDRTNPSWMDQING